MLLAAAATVLVIEAIGDSETVDEFAHLPAGVYYLRTGHFDLYDLSPPLLRELAALPVLAARPAGDFADYTRRPEEHWGLGYEFMEKNRARYHALYVLGRLPMIGLALALVVAVHACGTRLLGARAGLGAAALAAFCPTVLAHGHLVGTDVGAALGVFLAAWASLGAFRAPTVARTLVLGITLGGALLTKFSALALYPIVAVLAAVAAAGARPRWRPLAALAGAVALSVAIVNAGYLGRGTGAPLVADQLHSPTLRAVAARLGAVPVPLPAEFIDGLDRQHFEASSTYPVYLHGELSWTGWWYYYPVAFALKETLPMLLLVAAGAATLALGAATRDPLVRAFLAVPPLLFGVLLVTATDIDLGLRYLLPAYPFLFLVAAAPLAAGRRALAGVGALLVALHVAVSAAATPHHIAYMNALAGPPDQRWHWLVDSNLDWGQELRRLAAYQRTRGGVKLRLAYFGRVAPETYGIDYEAIQGKLGPGTYVVSASYLAGLPYFLWDHGTMYEPRPHTFAMFADRKPTAVIGHSLFVYDQ